MSNDISLLKEDSELRLRTESKRANLDFHSFGLDLKNIYIKAEYDSAVGFEDGIISFKINSNPVVLELSEKKKSKGLISFISKTRSDSKILFLKTYNLILKVSLMLDLN